MLWRKKRGGGSPRDPAAPDVAQSLMLRFQGGDKAAFEQLVSRCKRDVFAVAYRYGLRSHDADDLAQEVFLRVYRARESYRPDARFRSWLLRIATNLIISNARKKKLRRAASLQALHKGSGDDAVDFEDPDAPAPWARMDAAERQTLLEGALARLPENQRVAIIMNRFHEQSYEAIGTALGLKLPAVKSLLYRARQSLKRALEPYLGEEA